MTGLNPTGSPQGADMARQPMALPSFDELRSMAEQRPEDLERLRERMINEILEDLPEPRRRRLLGLIFRIELERKRAKTPMQACLKISQMMMDSVCELRDVMLNGPPAHRPESTQARIIPFKPRQTRH